jgi:hypothetical protein
VLRAGIFEAMSSAARSYGAAFPQFPSYTKIIFHSNQVPLYTLLQLLALLIASAKPMHIEICAQTAVSEVIPYP